MHETNLPRATVSRQADVRGAIHSRNMRNGAGGGARASGSQTEARGNRVSGSEAVCRQAMENQAAELKQCKADFNLMREGYAALVKAHAALMHEHALKTGEPIRYPSLDLPDGVVVDLIDEALERMRGV